MKKLLAILLSLAMLACLFAGCAGQEEPTPSSEAPSSEAPSSEAPSEDKPEDLSGTLVVYSTQTDADHEVFLKIFNEKYPNQPSRKVSDRRGAAAGTRALV